MATSLARPQGGGARGTEGGGEAGGERLVSARPAALPVQGKETVWVSGCTVDFQEGNAQGVEEEEEQVEEEEDEFGMFAQAEEEPAWGEGSATLPLAAVPSGRRGSVALDTFTDKSGHWASKWTDSSSHQSEDTWTAFSQDPLEEVREQWWQTKAGEKGTDKLSASLSSVFSAAFPSSPNPCDPVTPRHDDNVPTLTQKLQGARTQDQDSSKADPDHRRVLKPIPAGIGREAGIHPGQPPTTVTHTLKPTGNLTTANQPKCIFVDGGRKPEYPQTWLLDGFHDLNKMIGQRYKRANGVSRDLLLQSLHLNHAYTDKLSAPRNVNNSYSPGFCSSNQHAPAVGKRRLSYDQNRNVMEEH